MTSGSKATDAKNIVLQRINSALRAAPPAPVDIPRDYDRRPLAGLGDADRFAETVGEYRAQVYRVTVDEVAGTVAALVPAGARVIVPQGVPRQWVEQVDAVPDEPSHPISVAELDMADAVVTGCAVGIAATGTIVLDAGDTQGRRALTLVPDHHICVVFADQIVDTVPQAFERLNPTNPLTFISGPSATSDIELNRVEGVHGPRTLDVLVVA